MDSRSSYRFVLYRRLVPVLLPVFMVLNLFVVLYWVLGPSAFDTMDASRILLLVVTGGLTLLTVGAFALRYLSTTRYAELSNRERMMQHRASLENSERLAFMMQELREEVRLGTSRGQRRELEALIEQLRKASEESSTKIELTDEDRVDLKNEISTRLSETLSKSFVSELEEKYASEFQQSAILTELRSHFDSTRRRLGDEVDALSKRGNLNLVIGILTTLSAIALLAYVVLTTDISPDNWVNSIPGLVLRLALVIFIEVFSFFFLRLYKQSLNEIKYFQNEITNVEMRFIALESAVVRDDSTAVHEALRACATVERNFVLKKGETTVENQRLQQDKTLTKEIANAVADVLKTSASG